jgi:hypothetical protein
VHILIRVRRAVFAGLLPGAPVPNGVCLGLDLVRIEGPVDVLGYRDEDVDVGVQLR